MVVRGRTGAALILAGAVTLVAVACGTDEPEPAAPATTDAPPTTDAPAGTAPTTAPATTEPPSTAPPTTTDAPAPTTFDVEVATINVLHGFPAASDCAPETDQCNAPLRAELIWRMLDEQAGCPEIVALQEIDARWAEIVPALLPELCGGGYELLFTPVGSPDQEMILTTLPVIEHARTPLAGGPVWSAHWAQLDVGDGLVVDVFATHYASSALNLPCMDNPFDPCSAACPLDMTMGDCHPIQTIEFLDARTATGSMQLVIGDLNAVIDSDRLAPLLDDGFVDTHQVAGNPECPPDGGPTCTTGIGSGFDTDFAGLDVAETVPRRRIDFVLAKAPAGCEIVVDAADGDADGTRTGVWASTPFEEPVDGLFWAADHAGIQADIGLDCG